jgi:N-methylhydantoinase A/oxoprolinase/acetone carboxylase beta subunit
MRDGSLSSPSVTDSWALDLNGPCPYPGRLMKIGIGIDTGGTYTDAVAYDFDAKEILFSTKAQTTKEDLSIGIGNALDGLPSDVLRKAELISLSTTLATNACVENKGGRAKLLFIGVDKKVADWVGADYGLPNVEEIFFLHGKTDFKGEIVEEPDWSSLLTDGRDWIQDASAIAIVDIDAMDNSAVLEKRARELIAREYDVPSVCGHELFSDLNSIKRGVSILLNARLISLINDFIHATMSALKKRDIAAPVVIVRSDGSLMSEKFARKRPVETLLCGPAASVIGGLALTHERESLIVDMGGTTTDIAVIKDGIPTKATEGISIGKWSTFVRGLFVDTFGLGGDSAIRFGRDGVMVIEPNRLMPLAVAAARWPAVTEKLRKLLRTTTKHTLPLHEFFCLIKDIGDNPNYSQREIAFCKALRGGPLGLREAAEAAGTDAYNLEMQRLEDEGIVMRCGLTPTDIMHIRGDFVRFNTEAATLGAQFVASCIDVTPDALSDMVYDAMKKKLYMNIVRVLLEDQYPSFRKSGLGNELETLVSASWKTAITGNTHGLLGFAFRTPAVLVGIGAPTYIFLPDVAKALGTRWVVPENAGVANALGAVLGNITATCEIVIKPQYSIQGIEGYVVFGKTRNSYVVDKNEAVEIGLREATAEAKNEALRRGASGDITLTSRVVVSGSQASNKTEILFGITAIAMAIGGIGL